MDILQFVGKLKVASGETKRNLKYETGLLSLCNLFSTLRDADGREDEALAQANRRERRRNLENMRETGMRVGVQDNEVKTVGLRKFIIRSVQNTCRQIYGKGNRDREEANQVINLPSR